MHRVVGTLVRLSISIALLAFAGAFNHFHALSPRAAAPVQVTELSPASAAPEGRFVLVNEPAGPLQLSGGLPLTSSGLAFNVQDGTMLSYALAPHQDFQDGSASLCRLQPARLGLVGISAWTMMSAGAFEVLAR